MLAGFISDLHSFFTSTEGLEFLSLFFTLDGLICELFGVFIILAADYQNIRTFLTKYFQLPHVDNFRNLREWVNEVQIGLRKNCNFTNNGDSQDFTSCLGNHREYLERLILPNDSGGTNITKFEFVAQEDNPSLDSIVLRVNTSDHPNIIIENSEFEKWYKQAINREYYRQGAMIIVIGFVIMIVATISQIVAYWL